MSSNRSQTTRALAAFVLAHARYWMYVARQVHRQMRHWEARAQAIADPELRALALEKLRTEGFNAEAAAMAATIAPRATRTHAVRAIVALELLFDCLDGLSERAHADPLAEGERLYATFLAALDTRAGHSAEQLDTIGPCLEPGAQRPSAPDPPAPQPAQRPHAPNPPAAQPTQRPHAPNPPPAQPTQRPHALDADDYLRELGEAVRGALAQLPAGEAIASQARRCAARGAQAQIRMHATPLLGTEQLGEWARDEAQGTALQWREFAAGAACSVLALHALIAAAADPRTTPAYAQAIEQAYLFTGAMVTLLDGVVDHERDAAAGQLSYAGLYENPALLAQALACAAREAARHSSELRNGAHHLMTLAAAAAYWCSAPGARSARARPALDELQRELRGLLFVPLLAMRTWRVSRAARPRRRALATGPQL